MKPTRYSRASACGLACLLLVSLLLTACGTADNTATPAATGTTTTAPATPTPGLSQPATTATTAGASTSAATEVISPPGEPTSGPGGSSYNYASVKSSSLGSGGQKVYIYEPAEPTTQKAPVIILVHGWSGIDPSGYLPWINHLTRRGNIVLFPVYQEYRTENDGSKFTENAVVGIKTALAELQKGGHVIPELDKVTLAGYSAGGVIAANLTARAVKGDLPTPKALFAITPGGCSNCANFGLSNFNLDKAGLATIPPATKMLVLVGDADRVVWETGADAIWQATEQIPAANRDYIRVVSDNHGSPPLIADHGMAARMPPDAHNYYGIWKLTDALQSCATSGTACETALGGGPEQVFLGKWSDGTPVRPLAVARNP